MTWINTPEQQAVVDRIRASGPTRAASQRILVGLAMLENGDGHIAYVARKAGCSVEGLRRAYKTKHGH